MGFEWDGEKNQRNHAEHGLGFKAASEIFRDPARTEKRSDRHGIDDDWYNTAKRVNGIGDQIE